MKNRLINSLCVLLTAGLVACETGEMLNSEADIEEIIFPEGMKVGHPVISGNKALIPKLAITNSDVEELDRQVKTLIPRFVLSAGATISDDGIPKDFSQPQTYTVTSEDRKWTKTYEIGFSPILRKTHFSFSHYATAGTIETSKKKYCAFYELEELTGERQYVWASGNVAFALTVKETDPPEAFPTFAIPNGKVGTGVKLVTRFTGGFGTAMGMPFAAGNLFLGNFDMVNSMIKPLETTQFGVPVSYSKPLSLNLWAKYKAGSEYKDKNGNILPDTDHPEIYAVLYESVLDGKGNELKLNGSNVQTAPNIVSIAIMNENTANSLIVNDIDADEYRFIEIPFIYRQSFDPQKQAAGKYYFTVVFSSSAKGDLFEGAVGSALCIDEVEIVTE